MLWEALADVLDQTFKMRLAWLKALLKPLLSNTTNDKSKTNLARRMSLESLAGLENTVDQTEHFDSLLRTFPEIEGLVLIEPIQDKEDEEDPGPKFWKFPELPLEIRIKIWKLAIDHPMILTCQDNWQNQALSPKPTYFPGPLAVNKESRDEAKKAGYSQLYTTKTVKDPNATTPHHRSPFLFGSLFEGGIQVPVPFITFNSHIDTLFLANPDPTRFYGGMPMGSSYMSFDLKSARNVRSLALSFDPSWDALGQCYFPRFTEEEGQIDINDRIIQAF